MIEFHSIEQMKNHCGKPLGASGWRVIDQGLVRRFAAATGDFQWIHVDVERARRETPDGRTIAHGYLTLALVPMLSHEIWAMRWNSRSLNYGSDRIRFPAPVPVGSRIRLHQSLVAITEVKDDGLRVDFESTIEVENQDKPALIAGNIIVAYR